MKEDLRGVFFIMKGQYRQKRGVSFYNKVSEDTNYIGGYDPYDEETVEWYQLVDTLTWTSHCCGGDINRVVRGAFNLIKKYKTKERFLRAMQSDTFGGKTPPISVEIDKVVYEYYGDYKRELIEEQEDRVYGWLHDQTPLAKTKKRLRKRNVEVDLVSSVPVVETSLKKEISPRKNGALKLKRRKINIEME